MKHASRPWAALYTATLVLSGVLSLGCSARPNEHIPTSADAMARTDSAIFSALLVAIRQERVPRDIRVDPRPLRRDPALVTFHDFSAAPDLVLPEAQLRPLADVDSSIIGMRKQLLTAVGVGETDAFRDAQCPGGLAPPTDSIVAQRKRLCPNTQYRSHIASLPRPGGAYWPGNVDERGKYEGRDVMTVRVISRVVGPTGSVESSADYVFTHADGGWQYMKRKALLIVE